MGKKCCRQYRYTFMIELRDHDTEMRQQSRASLSHTFPTLASRRNVGFTD
jgi:hypothetical protein